MAARLGITLHTVQYKGNRWIRYPLSLLHTLLILAKARPKTVIAQNPSIVLTYFLLILRPLFGYGLVSDAHYGGIEAYNGSRLFQKALDICNHYADLVIVTNDAHARYVDRVGGKAFVCEDPLPDLPCISENGGNEKTVFFICSFDPDEPFEEVFKAAAMLIPRGYMFCISGNFRRAGLDPERYPGIKFLGYVPEEDFYSHLARSQVVLDLTSNENCLLCGAYEAMAAEKPLVTSDTRALRNYFTHGALFTQHEPESIARCIESAYRDRAALQSQIVEWKGRAVEEHERKIQRLRRELLPESAYGTTDALHRRTLQ
jgi:glycosyltransferase involved in cell wall biosynthesis